MIGGIEEKIIFWIIIRFIKSGGNPTSKISAHHSSDTVATFRSWRGFQSTIAKPPAGLPLQEQSIEIFYFLASQTL